jgi:hypothetical protein
LNSWKALLEQIKRPTSYVVIGLLSLTIAFPIFITLYAVFPPLILDVSMGIQGIRFDNFVLFIIIWGLFFWLIKKYNKFFYWSFGIGLLTLSLSSVIGFYSYRTLYHDFSAFIYNLSDEEIDIQFEEEGTKFPNKQQILNAIDYRNAVVKNKANSWAVKNFQKYSSVLPSLKILHCLSIFKEVKTRWNYVYDPKGPDYLSRASVTLSQLKDDDLLKGDCDDYSILMAALLTAVGGQVQLVLTEVEMPDGRVAGHIYPELNIGDFKDLEKIGYEIKNELFVIESMDKPIYYYIDKDNTIWLNMDYNDDYPGGKYQSKLRKSVLLVEDKK